MYLTLAAIMRETGASVLTPVNISKGRFIVKNQFLHRQVIETLNTFEHLSISNIITQEKRYSKSC